MWGILGACFLLFLFAGIPIALVMYMAAALGITAFAGFDPTFLVQQIFSGLESFTILAVPLFIISGGIAANGGTSRSLIDVIQVIFGRFRGSLAISTVVASAFFAAITGTTLATIVAIGAIMIPALLKAGYPKKFACGIVCAGGTLGILIPPSVPMVNLSVAMGSSVAKQFTAGFVPGVLLALIWCVMVVFYCRKAKIDDRKYYTRAESVKAFKNGILAILYPVIVLGSIYGGFATPTEAAVISIVYVSLVELFFYKSIKLPDLLRSAGQAAVTGGGILMLVAGAKAISWFVAANQIPADLHPGPHPGHHPDQLRRGLCTVRHHLYPLLPAGQPDAPLRHVPVHDHGRGKGVAAQCGEGRGAIHRQHGGLRSGLRLCAADLHVAAPSAWLHLTGAVNFVLLNHWR